MSDCFDHEAEALDRYFAGEGDTAYDDGYGHTPRRSYDYIPTPKYCKYCGAEVSWDRQGAKWFLVENKDGRIVKHNCPNETWR